MKIKNVFTNKTEDTDSIFGNDSDDEESIDLVRSFHRCKSPERHLLSDDGEHTNESVLTLVDTDQSNNYEEETQIEHFNENF